ncbi:hypothetical protein KBA73_03090 [Patescibacteria group bacterium]|nr:hypothetical protein [Patescibacteria group bacterium]
MYKERQSVSDPSLPPEDDFAERVKKYSAIQFRFGKQAEHVIQENLFPQGIEEWPQEIREMFIEVIARVGCSLRRLTWQGSDSWSKAFYDELELFCRRAPTQLDAIESLKNLGALLMMGALDSNMQGDAGRKAYQTTPEKIYRRLREMGDETSAERIYNPFQLQQGTELFSYEQWLNEEDSSHPHEIVKKQFGEVSISDQGGVIVLDDELTELSEINRSLSRGDLMLRSGMNIFGGADHLLKEFPVFAPEGRTILLSRNPLNRADIIEFTCVGSNAAALTERYGMAWLPVSRDLLLIDIRDDQGKIHRQCEFSRGFSMKK